MITKIVTYVPKTTAFAHQDSEWIQSRSRPYYGLFWEMGTGKSKTIIDTIGYLYCNKEIDGVVLVGDKGNYRNWVKELKAHLPESITTRIAVWNGSTTKAEQAALSQIASAKDNVLDILIVNIESFVSDRSTDVVMNFVLHHYTLMCVDEATSIKNPKAQRTKAAIKLGQRCDYRRVLTGTPITQSPLDVFSMCEFLCKGVTGFPNFTSFRAYYAIMMRMNLGPNRPSFDKITGFRNLEHLTQTLDSFSSRITKDECLDLPPKIYEVVEVELTIEQRKAYDSLKQTALIQLEQGLLTSTSALTTINKLQQIVCGHVKLDDGMVVDLPNNRTRVLLDALDVIGNDRKVIIWCAFQRDVQLIMSALREEKRSAVAYYGLTSDEDREQALTAFVDHDAQCFVGTQSTGGKGITLTVATYVIYFSNTYSLEDRLQSEDRAHRIGQDQNVTIIDLVSPGTVDMKILESHKMKKDLAHEVLGNMRQILS